MEGTGVEWSGGEGRGGKGRAGQGRVPDCLGGLSRVGISSRSTRPWNGQPPSLLLIWHVSSCTLTTVSYECCRVDVYNFRDSISFPRDATSKETDVPS